MRKIIFRLKDILIKFFRLVLSIINGGEDCIICGKKSCVSPVCHSCARLFLPQAIQSQKRCRCCGKLLLSENELCMSCRKKSVFQNVDKCYPLFSYRLWNKELLFLWKINGVRWLSGFFSQVYAKNLNLLDIKYLVPVPPRPGKIRQNGWDQIDEVCKYLEYVYDFKILKLLKRISLVQQKKLNRIERLSKTKTSYLLAEKKIEKIRYKNGGCLPSRVCIIDDVCTTGSTIETCAGLLRSIPEIKEVLCMTLFIVD